MSMEILINDNDKEGFRKFHKLYQRVRKYGDVNVVNKRGRKPKTESHKKRTTQTRLNQLNELKKKAGIPVYEKRGRPPKA